MDKSSSSSSSRSDKVIGSPEGTPVSPSSNKLRSQSRPSPDRDADLPSLTNKQHPSPQQQQPQQLYFQRANNNSSNNNNNNNNNNSNNNNKMFRLINTDVQTVKQNNFYFTKQQKKLQLLRPDRTISVVTLPPIDSSHTTTADKSLTTIPKEEEEEPFVNIIPPPQLQLESKSSSTSTTKLTKIRWRRPVTSPNPEFSSLVPQVPQSMELDKSTTTTKTTTTPPTIVHNNNITIHEPSGISYVYSPDTKKSSPGIDTEIREHTFTDQLQQQQHQYIEPLENQEQYQQPPPQQIPLKPFESFPPIPGTPYGMFPFLPPFPGYQGIPGSNWPQHLPLPPPPPPPLPHQLPPYPPIFPGFQPPGMYSPPPPFMITPTPPPNNNDNNNETPNNGENALFQTQPHSRKRLLSNDGSLPNNMRPTSSTATTFVHPMPIFPPPPPAHSTSRGPELIPPYPPKPEMERANLTRLLDASSHLPLMDMDFFQLVGSLDQMLKLKKQFEFKTEKDEEEDAEEEENDEDEESETEDQLAFMDRRMERYYFKKENDLETYYNNMKFKRGGAPYVLNFLDLKENNENYEAKAQKTTHIVPLATNSEDYLEQTGEEEEEKAIYKRFNDLGLFFNENIDLIYQERKLYLIPLIKLIEDETNDEFRQEVEDLEEYRDFELLRLKNFGTFQRNESLRFYYDDMMGVYQKLSQLILQKLTHLRNFLVYQKEMLGNGLDKELLDISSTKSARFIKSFGTNVNSSSSDEQQFIANTTTATTSTTNDIVTVEPSTTRMLNEISSSDTDLTTQSGGGAAESTAQLLSSKAKANRQKKILAMNRLRRQQKTSVAAARAAAAKAKQQHHDEYTPLLTTSEFEFITDTTTNFYAKVLKFFENSERYPQFQNSSQLLQQQQQQQLQSVKTRSTNMTSRRKSPDSTPLKKLSNLAKSIRDSNGFSGGIAGGNDHTLQLQKVMKMFKPPPRLQDDEILNDLKLMGFNTEKWIT